MDVELWERDYKWQLMAWAISKIRSEFSDNIWTAFQRTAIEEIPANDAAAELAVSPGSIHVAKSRVLKRLREKIHSVASEMWEMDANDSTGKSR